MEELNLSAHPYVRIVKVARIIADHSNPQKFKAEHLSEALQYSSLDREGWAG